jgi:CubicO group peptidase (beta-lactamase class C family)
MEIVMRALIITLILVFLAVQGAAARAVETNPVEEIFAYLADNNLFNGVALVVNGGEVAAARALGYANFEWMIPNTLDTRFRIGSISKQFTAVLALVLVEDGHLFLSDPVGKYLPEINRPWMNDVTIHHLLAQTSGIPNYTLLEGYLDGIDQQRFTLEEFLDYLAADELMDSLHFEPGSDFDYSNTNYLFAGLIIQRIMGRPFEAVLREMVLEPLGMRDTGPYDDLKLIRCRAYGYEKAPDDTYEPTRFSASSPKSIPSGGIYSTAADMLRWHQALQENELLSRDLMEIFLTPHHRFSDTEGYAYANYWCRYRLDESRSLDVYEHGGSMFGTTAMFYRVPAADQCVILLGNGGIGRENFFSSIAYATIDALNGRALTLPKCDLLGTIGYTAMSKSPEAVRAHYAFLKRRRPEAYDFGVGQLSTLGHVMIQLFDGVDIARLVFTMNAEKYPEEPSVWVDLGTLSLRNGEPETAVSHLEKAAALSGGDEDIEALLLEAKRAAAAR